MLLFWSESEAFLVGFSVCPLSGCSNGVSGGVMVARLCLLKESFSRPLISVCSGWSSDSLVPRWLLVKEYKEVGVLGLPMKVLLEKEALVSGVGRFSLGQFRRFGSGLVP
ncbi:hypothetical protein Bca4012_085707 [Brassica carinata]